MAKGGRNLLGSGSSRRSNMQNTAPLGIPGQDSDTPWVDPQKGEAAKRAGIAGKMLAVAKSKSKSTGLGGRVKGGGSAKRTAQGGKGTGKVSNIKASPSSTRGKRRG